MLTKMYSYELSHGGTGALHALFAGIECRRILKQIRKAQKNSGK